MKTVILMLAVLLSSLAMANDYPVNPNPAGQQTTTFSNNYFSATFNGPVTDETKRNSGNTSTNYLFKSGPGTNGVYQIVDVRIVDHDIAADLSSSNFYADSDTGLGPVTDRSTNVWEGHPFTYTRRVKTYDGEEYETRTRYIIVSSRVVIFIQQFAPTSLDTNQREWFDFEYSLRIK